MTQEKEVAVVTGSSNGVGGFETSIMLARSRFRTCATMRNLQGKSKQITDITKNENRRFIIWCSIIIYRCP
jgi:NAD(P)-dependent dehydrogenase (short-subunit alcohol dehydrogenase family)